MGGGLVKQTCSAWILELKELCQLFQHFTAVTCWDTEGSSSLTTKVDTRIYITIYKNVDICIKKTYVWLFSIMLIPVKKYSLLMSHSYTDGDPLRCIDMIYLEKMCGFWLLWMTKGPLVCWYAVIHPVLNAGFDVFWFETQELSSTTRETQFVSTWRVAHSWTLWTCCVKIQFKAE